MGYNLDIDGIQPGYWWDRTWILMGYNLDIDGIQPGYWWDTTWILMGYNLDIDGIQPGYWWDTTWILMGYNLDIDRIQSGYYNRIQHTRCPEKHGNSVTNWISSLLWISIVIPNFKSLNIIVSATVYFIKRVKYCKDVSIMSPQDEQWRRTRLLCLYTAIFLYY